MTNKHDSGVIVIVCILLAILLVAILDLMGDDPMNIDKPSSTPLDGIEAAAAATDEEIVMETDFIDFRIPPPPIAVEISKTKDELTTGLFFDTNPAMMEHRAVFDCGGAIITFSRDYLERTSKGNIAYRMTEILGIDENRKLYDAMCLEESVNGTVLVGDGGRSRGPYHIGKLYYKDACEEIAKVANYDVKLVRKTLPYKTVVESRVLSEIIMKFYWQRYNCLTDEAKARCHVGGPNGMSKESTKDYWRRIQGTMNDSPSGRAGR